MERGADKTGRIGESFWFASIYNCVVLQRANVVPSVRRIYGRERPIPRGVWGWGVELLGEWASGMAPEHPRTVSMA